MYHEALPGRNRKGRFFTADFACAILSNVDKGEIGVKTAAGIFLWLIIYSFAGWAYETALCSFLEKKPVNRGFLNGPVCPIYGFGALAVIAAFGARVQSTTALFLASAMLACILEYLTSWAMEKLFFARWWDYSHRPFNLNGRVCLEGFVVFGAFSVLLVRVIHPFVRAQVLRIPTAALLTVSGGMFAIFAADVFVTVRHVLGMGGRLAEVQAQMDRFRAAAEQRGERWLAETEKRLEQRRDALLERFAGSEFYSERIARLMNLRRFQDIRLTRAFPRMRTGRYTDALEELKRRLKSGR